VKYLEKVLKQKQELQNKLAGIEKTEQMLRAKIAELQIKQT
jgi:cell division protein FtsB